MPHRPDMFLLLITVRHDIQISVCNNASMDLCKTMRVVVVIVDSSQSVTINGLSFRPSSTTVLKIGAKCCVCGWGHNRNCLRASRHFLRESTQWSCTWTKIHHAFVPSAHVEEAAHDFPSQQYPYHLAFIVLHLHAPCLVTSSMRNMSKGLLQLTNNRNAAQAAVKCWSNGSQYQSPALKGSRAQPSAALLPGRS